GLRAFDATNSPGIGTPLGSTTQVQALLPSGGTLYVGGSFPTFGGGARRGLGAIADPAFDPLLNVPPPPGASLGFALGQSVPNPFHAAVRIPFTLSRAGVVRLSLIDVGGRVMRTLIDGEQLDAGPHEVAFRREALRPGLYWYRLECNGQ